MSQIQGKRQNSSAMNTSNVILNSKTSMQTNLTSKMDSRSPTPYHKIHQSRIEESNKKQGIYHSNKMMTSFRDVKQTTESAQKKKFQSTSKRRQSNSIFIKTINLMDDSHG